MIAPNPKPSANELGAKTTYQLFLEREEIPAIRAFHIEDIRKVELHPWPRMGAGRVSQFGRNRRCQRLLRL